MSYLRIALAKPLYRLFDYLPPKGISEQSQPLPGCRFKVPFGRSEEVGILIEQTEQTELPTNKLRHALCQIDSLPIIDPPLLSLIRWAASYYQHPEGDALLQCLPTLLKQGAPCEYLQEEMWKLKTERTPTFAANAHRQKELFELIQQHPSGISGAALRALGFDRAQLLKLQQKQLIQAFHFHPAMIPQQPLNGGLRETPLSLNDEQSHALEQIDAASGFQTFLLDGITGSGKTEIYLQAIQKALNQQQQALVLIPEIGLTPQTTNRFRQRFQVPVVTLHSGLTDRQRLDGWLQARDGHAGILIGTRSALFTPFAALGIIVVDEEHDPSLKQQDGFRYSARDLAVLRARQHNIPIILGSATPSLESLHNAMLGRYQWLKLRKRAASTNRLKIELLDTRLTPLQDGLSPALEQSIAACLKRKEQVLIFLNRRGYSPALNCSDCGNIIHCQHCDAAMTLHHYPARLHCHHCDRKTPIPRQCQLCGSEKLTPTGQGTERVEQKLAELFPKTLVIRVDRDSTQKKQAMEKIRQQVASGQPCILVGTQMLAKGHHFPDVTLVAILNADGGLFSADFRAMERTAQLILQVAGRAGRAEKQGRVIMQTEHADHPVLQQLCEFGYQAYAEQELKHRQQADLPPFSHYAIIRAEHLKPEIAQQFLNQLRWYLQRHSDAGQIQCIGPFPAPMQKRANYHRAQLHLSCHHRPILQQLLAATCLHLEQLPEARRLRWSIDVDPADSF